MSLQSLLDLPWRLHRKWTGGTDDYRAFLFEELAEVVQDHTLPRILEIGPRDGIDTRRLLQFEPEELILADLPDKEARVRQWLGEIDDPRIRLIIGNVMYDDAVESLPPFDLVWCTGVLYHNPEQLRMLRRLHDFLKPGGVLVLESATARRLFTRHANCVEIWHNEEKAVHRRHHVSQNVTHLPSRRAIASWLEMIGFVEVKTSRCHRKISPGLAATRAAFIARRPLTEARGTYYTHVELNYVIGKAR
ncbi:MAG: methyltransferase domain-containing protein [Magnetococcales bacterium]|nr:methyltransferase domain-containing protein [Magnetococcales bacterium]